MKKTFLLFVVLILFATFLYVSTFVSEQKKLIPVDVKAFEIESRVKMDDVEETLLKLKLAVDDSTDDLTIEEDTADEILAVLEENIPVVAVATVVIPKEKPKKVIIKKKIVKPKRVVKKIVKKNLIQNETIEKKKIIRVKKLPIPKKVVSLSPVVSSVEVINKTQAHIALGEQNDIHTLSQSERKKFNHLEVVSTSKVFELEPEQEMKSPIKFQGFQKEVKFNDLEFVETLGVVSKSIPSIKRDE